MHNEYIVQLVHWKYFPIVLIIIVCILGWCITSAYLQSNKSAQVFLPIKVNIPHQHNNMMLDERIFRNTIELQDRDPRWLTSSMVAPQVVLPSDEKRKGSRMEVFNMFYDNGIDDEITIKSRPRNLYIVP